MTSAPDRACPATRCWPGSPTPRGRPRSPRRPHVRLRLRPGRPDIDELAHEVYGSFLDVNGLDPTVFPSLLAMENDVIAIAAAHLGGGPATVGSFTSGGTESIILAVKAARDWAARW